MTSLPAFSIDLSWATERRSRSARALLAQRSQNSSLRRKRGRRSSSPCSLIGFAQLLRRKIIRLVRGASRMAKQRHDTGYDGEGQQQAAHARWLRPKTSAAGLYRQPPRRCCLQLARNRDIHDFAPRPRRAAPAEDGLGGESRHFCTRIFFPFPSRSAALPRIVRRAAGIIPSGPLF